MLTGLTLLVAIGATVLQNAGFEDTDPLSVWKIYSEVREGRDPVIRADKKEFKEGKQSLVLSPADPARLSVGQRIYLPVGSLWRLSGWIKTEDLDPKDRTSVVGAIDIQTPAGSLGRTQSRKGTSDWQEEHVTFRVASPGEINIVLVHSMQGRATGTAWFDGIRLEPIADAASTGVEDVRISSRRLTRLPIDAKQG